MGEILQLLIEFLRGVFPSDLQASVFRTTR
jgi:hypothetical protein